MRLGKLLLFCAAFGCGIQPASADEDFAGTVTRIFDGDSFLVRPARGKDIDVRLLDIDAPEKNQPHGDDARAALVKLIGNRRVYVDVIDVDHYDRKLARVYREPDRLDIARALVHDGHVWVDARCAIARSLRSRMPPNPPTSVCGRCRNASAFHPGSSGIWSGREKPAVSGSGRLRKY